MNQLNPQNPTSDPEPHVLDAVLLPSLVPPEFFSGKTVVVVDVLRATTTITSAIHSGCRFVLPQGSIEVAKTTYQQFETDPLTTGVSMLGGERKGKIVPGFHGGNSPVEYTPEVADDKILILATTNGTVAMDHCSQASRILIGSMVNLTAVAQQVISDPDLVVLCSGTDGLITSEDVIFAGAFLQRVTELREQSGLPVGKFTDPAMIAINHWQTVQGLVEGGAALSDFFKNARGGINLVKIGHSADIEFAANIDSLPIVSELNTKTWQIRQVSAASG